MTAQMEFSRGRRQPPASKLDNFAHWPLGELLGIGSIPTLARGKNKYKVLHQLLGKYVTTPKFVLACFH